MESPHSCGRAVEASEFAVCRRLVATRSTFVCASSCEVMSCGLESGSVVVNESLKAAVNSHGPSVSGFAGSNCIVLSERVLLTVERVSSARGLGWGAQLPLSIGFR